MKDEKTDKEVIKLTNKGKAKIKKLSYKEQKELEELPRLIEKLEQEQIEIFNILSDTDYYKKDPNEVESTQLRSEELEQTISNAYERWNYLERMREEIENRAD
ncbi:MAG: hypothetical protein GTN99_00275 [Candidatus Dadabacteria bacterium]|nr:hypothetical protein [Candidatus Dadabacteria bacterium]